MKKLSWIVAGLLALSGIGMIAGSFFPVSAEYAAEKTEIPAGEGIVIGPETSENSDEKKDIFAKTEAFFPRTDPDVAEDSSYTLPEKAEMKDGSIGVLTIESIGVSVPVYETDDEMETMRKGIAHYKTTSAWNGNIGLCAHNGNASYCWFRDLHKLEKGDVVIYQTALGTRTYQVSEVREIEETDWSMLGRTEDNRVTMTTCIDGKPSKRLCVQAVEIVKE